MRVGVYGAQNGACTQGEYAIGVGLDGSLSASAGGADDGVSAVARHAALLVRSSDFTDASVGTRESCAAHLAAGAVVDGTYTLGSAVAFCDMP